MPVAMAVVLPAPTPLSYYSEWPLTAATAEGHIPVTFALQYGRF